MVYELLTQFVVLVQNFAGRYGVTGEIVNDLVIHGWPKHKTAQLW